MIGRRPTSVERCHGGHIAAIYTRGRRFFVLPLDYVGFGQLDIGPPRDVDRQRRRMPQSWCGPTAVDQKLVMPLARWHCSNAREKARLT